MDQDLFQVDRENKQNYLRDEILAGGYDPEEFKMFLDCVKAGGGSNVDVWDLDELMSVVERFKAEMIEAGFHPQSSEHQLDDERLQTLNSPDHPPTNVGKDEKDANSGDKVVEDEKSKATDKETEASEQLNRMSINSPNKVMPMMNQEVRSEDDDFYKVIKCKEVEASELTTEKSIIKEGIFSSPYLSMNLVTSPLGWDVQRKFSDFVWIRGLLLKFYPHLIIPPLPKEKGKRRFDEVSVRKRRVLLEKFIEECLEHEEIKADKYFLSFLSVQDTRKKWRVLKKETEKLERPAKITDYVKPKGAAVLQVGSELKEYAQSAFELIYTSQPLYRSMRTLSKQLITEFKQLANTIFNLSVCFEDLYKLAFNFNSQTVLGQNAKLDRVYSTMNTMMNSWGNEMLNQGNIVQTNLCDFFKYTHIECDSMKEILKHRSDIAAEFLKFKKTLDGRKERHFNLKDIDKWCIPQNVRAGVSNDTLLSQKPLAFELMFPKETQMEHELRDKFAFYNFEAFAQIDKTLRRKCNTYKNNFVDFAKAQSQSLSEVHIRWADVLSLFTDHSIDVSIETPTPVLKKRHTTTR